MLYVISTATQIRMFKVCVLLRGLNIQGKLLSKRDPPINSRLAHNIKAESQITSYIHNSTQIASAHLEADIRRSLLKSDLI